MSHKNSDELLPPATKSKEAYRQQLLKQFKEASTVQDREAIRQKMAILFAESATPIDMDLHSLGLPSLGSLSNSKVNYKSALPVLLKWLFQAETNDVKSAILGALAVDWSRPIAAKPLIQFLAQLDPASAQELRWSVGNALEHAADDSVLDDIISIAENKDYGINRQMFIMALGNMKDPKATDVLINLLNDPEALPGAVAGLAKVGAPKSRSCLEVLLNHPEPWIRKEAKKGITKIDKKYARQDMKAD